MPETTFIGTGLRVNYHKSSIYPINVPNQKLELLTNTFQCKIGSLPFAYLGLPMGLRKPNLEAFLPLIQKIEKRLSSTSTFLSQAGRLQMVNAVFHPSPHILHAHTQTPKIGDQAYKQIQKTMPLEGRRHQCKEATTGCLEISMYTKQARWTGGN
jgi:hypothetical protein